MIDKGDTSCVSRTISALADAGDLEAIGEAVQEYDKHLSAPGLECYTDHKILDAVLTSHLGAAKHRGIRVSIRVSIPDEHPFNEAGHGFGTRSIAAFCARNNAFYEFTAVEDEFTMRLIFNR